MRRDQLERAIRMACQIIGSSEVIAVGSQAILGTFDEHDLPAAATMSLEIDVLPIADTAEETTRLADQIEGIAGEFSPFEDLHGFSIDGVDLSTSALAAGWLVARVTGTNFSALGTIKCLESVASCGIVMRSTKALRSIRPRRCRRCGVGSS